MKLREALKDLRQLNNIVGTNQTLTAPEVVNLLAQLNMSIKEEMPMDEPILEGNYDADSGTDDAEDDNVAGSDHDDESTEMASKEVQ